MDQYLNLKRGEAGKTVIEIDFSLTKVWVQIRNLPPDLVNDENADVLGMKFPMCEAIQVTKNSKWTGTIRLRVGILVDKPLKTGFRVENEIGKLPDVTLRMKGLSIYVSIVVRLDHAKNCKNNVPYSTKKRFGQWLRADYNFKTGQIEEKEKEFEIHVMEEDKELDKLDKSVEAEKETDQPAGGVVVSEHTTPFKETMLASQERNESNDQKRKQLAVPSQPSKKPRIKLPYIAPPFDVNDKRWREENAKYWAMKSKLKAKIVI